MRNKISAFLISLFLAFSIAPQSAFSTMITIQPSLTVGGRVFTDLNNLITLSARVTGATYSTLRKPNGTSGYQVTAGKTLTIYAMKCVGISTTNAFKPGYGTTDAGQNGAAPSGSVVFAGDIGTNTGFVISGAGSVLELAVNMTVPANDFPYIVSGSASDCYCLAYGYEQ